VCVCVLVVVRREEGGWQDAQAHLSFFSIFLPTTVKRIYIRDVDPLLHCLHTLNHITYIKVELADLAGIDDSLLASLTWVLHNSIEGILFETFTAPASSSSVSSSSGNVGQSENDKKEDDMELVELCPGGRHIEVLIK